MPSVAPTATAVSGCPIPHPRSGRSHVQYAVDAQVLEEPPVFRVRAAPDEEVLEDSGGPLIAATRASHRDLPLV